MHLILDGYGGERDRLADERVVRKFLDETPGRIGMSKISEPATFHYDGVTPGDGGVSGFVVVAESHLSIHTWPEYGVLWADIFSCKEFDVEPVMDALREAFALVGCQTQVLRRGLSAAAPLMAEVR